MDAKTSLLLAGVFASLPVIASLAADSVAVPERSIAVKKELLFSDDFEGTERSSLWHRVVPTFVFEGGMLKGTQTRDQNIPAQDGRPAQTPHAAVYGLNLPTKDSVVEVKMKFSGATAMDVEFDDRAYKGAHYGHLCRAIVRPDRVTIMDEREGTQNEVVKAMRLDPATKDEANRIIARHMAHFPLAEKVEQGKWYTVVVETVGEAMRVTIDGKPVAFFKSPGIGHATKSKIEVGVSGKDGFFDDIKVWNAEPAK
ncbi:MAG: hypothetical protein K0Q72_4136 [Armatimonadetes bacterium]|jgi:hypothetical protein|nr:hypothetical protein [Armatimonadota bacterium]